MTDTLRGRGQATTKVGVRLESGAAGGRSRAWTSIRPQPGDAIVIYRAALGASR